MHRTRSTLNSVTDRNKKTRAGDESKVASYTKLKGGLRKEHCIACDAQKRCAKWLTSWWEKKQTKAPVGGSGAIAICRSCCEKGNKFSVMHRRASEEYCESSPAHPCSYFSARAVILRFWHKTGVKIVLVGLLVFHCGQGVSALGTERRKQSSCLQTCMSECWSSDTNSVLKQI